MRSTNGDIIKELERRLKVSDPVIKYQTIRLDEELKRQQKLVHHSERRASRRPRKQAAAPAAPQPIFPPAEQTAARLKRISPLRRTPRSGALRPT